MMGFFGVECRGSLLGGKKHVGKTNTLTTDFIQMLLIKIRVKMIDCLPLSEGNVNFCTIILGHRHIGSNLSSPSSSNHHGNHEEIQFPRAKSPLPKPFKDGHHYVDDYWRRSQEVHMEVSSEPRHIKPMVLSTYSSKSIHIPICIWNYFFSLYMSKGVVCSGTGLYHFLSFFLSCRFLRYSPAEEKEANFVNDMFQFSDTRKKNWKKVEFPMEEMSCIWDALLTDHCGSRSHWVTSPATCNACFSFQHMLCKHLDSTAQLCQAWSNNVKMVRLESDIEWNSKRQPDAGRVGPKVCCLQNVRIYINL